MDRRCGLTLAHECASNSRSRWDPCSCPLSAGSALQLQRLYQLRSQSRGGGDQFWSVAANVEVVDGNVAPGVDAGLADAAALGADGAAGAAQEADLILGVDVDGVAGVAAALLNLRGAVIEVAVGGDVGQLTCSARAGKKLMGCLALQTIIWHS